MMKPTLSLMKVGLQPCPSQPNPTLPRYAKPRTHLPQDKWQEIAHRNASGESLRQLAEIYGVSYEAIRQVIKKVTQT